MKQISLSCSLRPPPTVLRPFTFNNLSLKRKLHISYPSIMNEKSTQREIHYSSVHLPSRLEEKNPPIAGNWEPFKGK